MQGNVLAAVFLSVFGLASSVFGQQFGRTQVPTDLVLAPLGLKRAWWSQATIDYGREQLEFLTSDEQATFAQTDTGMVTAVDNATGRRCWSVQIGARSDTRFPLVTNDQEVLIVSAGTCYALNKRTGDVRWQLPTPSASSTGPAMDDTQVYLGGSKGSVHALSATLLDEYTKKNEMPTYGYRVHQWDFRTGGRVLFPVVSTGAVVYVAGSDRSLYGLAAKDRKLRFIFETDQRISAPMTYSGNQLYAAGEDTKLYCLDAAGGALKWELLIGHHMIRPPVAITEHVFVCPEQDGLHCVAAASGRELWFNRQASGFLAATPATVYASAPSGDVLVLNRADGRKLGSFPLEGFPIRIANDRTDRLYFAAPSGLMLCIRERDLEFPLYYKVPETRPVLPEVAPEQYEKKARAKTKPAGETKKKEVDDSGEEKPSEDK